MSARNSKSAVNWPRRLNRLLIGVGVIAFGLIIGDRLMSVFKREQATVAQTTSSDHAGSGSSEVATEPEMSAANQDGTPIERNVSVDTGGEFGSQLVFVSLSEPKYVVTADRQRYYIGSAIGEDSVLADVTGEQVIIDRGGSLTSFDLDDSGNQ